MASLKLCRSRYCFPLRLDLLKRRMVGLLVRSMLRPSLQGAGATGCHLLVLSIVWVRLAIRIGLHIAAELDVVAHWLLAGHLLIELLRQLLSALGRHLEPIVLRVRLHAIIDILFH